MKNDKLNTGRMNQDEFEDILHEAGVFYNGLRGKESTCSMDSYMTCINYAVFDQQWDLHGKRNTKEEWLPIIANWESHAYLSPNCYLIACLVKRKLNIPVNHT